MEYRYTVKFRYRNWRRKPDPSGFGVAFMYTNDAEWASREAAKGHQILSVTDHQEAADGSEVPRRPR